MKTNAENNNAMSLADEILALDDLPSEDVTVPEWGGLVVTISTLPAAEKDDWEGEMFDDDGELKRDNYRARLVVRVALKDGKRIFRNDHATALGRKSSAAISRLYDVAARRNAVRKSDEEELIKNSEGGRPADSPTDSQGISNSDGT